MKSALEQTLDRLREKKEGALMPFLVIGDPDPKLSEKLALALTRGGADLLEFGLAFSDPPADGPVIQAAGKRALAAGATTDFAFEYLGRVKRATERPIALLVYYNLILRRGIGEFYRSAKEAGVDAILVADVPVEESAPISDAADANEIAPIFIISELTSEARLEAISKRAKGYLYLVAHVGITGERSEVDARLSQVIARARSISKLPILCGFGLSRREHVQKVMSLGADGAIVGSALVQRIEDYLRNEATMLENVESFVRTLKEGTRTC